MFEPSESQRQSYSILNTSENGEDLTDNLPNPHTLKEYEKLGLLETAIKIYKDKENRYYEYYKEEQRHRHQCERQEEGDRRLGLILGFVISVIAIIVGSLVAMQSPNWGAQIAGGIIGAGGTTRLAGVFVKGVNQKHQQKEENQSSDITSNEQS